MEMIFNVIWHRNGEADRNIATTPLLTLLFILMMFAFGTSTVYAQKAKTPPKCGKNALTEAEITALVNDHNTMRSEVKSPKVVWDCSLADMAQAWADKGVFGHSGTELGENMFVASNANTAPSAAVARWMAEKPNWDNKLAKCGAGKVCTHYTQVVWKKTLKVGCGINRNASGKWKTVLVCNYTPAGNFPGPAF